MSVSVEQATVYRASNGKRYFTKRAACRRDVMFRLQGGLCKSDKEELFEDHRKIADRYWRMWKRKLLEGGAR